MIHDEDDTGMDGEKKRMFLYVHVYFRVCGDTNTFKTNLQNGVNQYVNQLLNNEYR